MGIFESQKKVLAGTNHSYDADFRRVDRSFAKRRCCPIHLYDFLIRSVEVNPFFIRFAPKGCFSFLFKPHGIAAFHFPKY